MQLLLSLACEDARTRPDGRLDFIGVFDELQAPGFPAAQDRMTVVFVMEWAPDEQGRKEFRADLLDGDDRKVLTIEGHTDVGADSASTEVSGRPKTQLVMPLERVVFPHEGEYRFVLQVGDVAMDAFSLFVSGQSG
jgi:hypothetical protein